MIYAQELPKPGILTQISAPRAESETPRSCVEGTSSCSDGTWIICHVAFPELFSGGGGSCDKVYHSLVWGGDTITLAGALFWKSRLWIPPHGSTFLRCFSTSWPSSTEILRAQGSCRDVYKELGGT